MGQAQIRAGDWSQEAAALLGALDSLRVALTIFDAGGRLVYANAHLNYLFRSLPPLPRLIGKSYEDLIRLEIEGGEIAAKALEGGAAVFIADRLCQLDPGHYTPRDILLADRRVVEIKARHARDGRVVLLWSDVTAARAQFARLEEAVALSADAFAFYDPSDKLVMANELYAALVGVPLRDLVGCTFPEVVAQITHRGRLVLDEPPETWLKRRLENHRQPVGHLTIRTNGGEAYLVRDRATADGGRAMIFTDITDRVRAEKALTEQQHALADSRAQAERQSGYLADLSLRLDQATAKANSAKTTLLRTMSHELKTPLNAILGFSDLMMTLADNLTPDQVREYAGLVHQGGTNLLKMINQIMDLTKISAGRYELHRAPVDPGSLLWLARESFMARAQARGLTIDADGCPVGLTIHADESVFAAMLHSLIDNAVTFTPAGGRITLSAAARGRDIAVSVEDNGHGVSPEDLARILEPFEHAGRSEGRDHAKGAGLGLTVVKAFAELHGGRLELASAPGQGFRATLVMPAAQG